MFGSSSLCCSCDITGDVPTSDIDVVLEGSATSECGSAVVVEGDTEGGEGVLKFSCACSVVAGGCCITVGASKVSNSLESFVPRQINSSTND